MRYAIRLKTETATPTCGVQDYWVREDGTLTTKKDDAKCFRDQSEIPAFQATLPYPTKMESW